MYKSKHDNIVKILEFDSHGDEKCRIEISKYPEDLYYDENNYKDTDPARRSEWLKAGYEAAARIITNDELLMTIYASRDQWGVYFSFEMGKQDQRAFTIAQEDGTRSFFSCLNAAIRELREFEYGCKEIE